MMSPISHCTSKKYEPPKNWQWRSVLVTIRTFPSVFSSKEVIRPVVDERCFAIRGNRIQQRVDLRRAASYERGEEAALVWCGSVGVNAWRLRMVRRNRGSWSCVPYGVIIGIVMWMRGRGAGGMRGDRMMRMRPIQSLTSEVNAMMLMVVVSGFA
jgi:hypothetical protein